MPLIPMKPPPRLPPLWLSASTLTAAIAVAFGVARWVSHFTSDPNAEDFRLHVVAARVGLKYGWNRIYDLDLNRIVSAGLGPIDSSHAFISPPPMAWMVLPASWLPVSAGYLMWTVISLAAFIAAWWLVVPGTRMVRIAVLLVSLALWPVHYQFWLGQWVAASLALLALTWWLLQRDRWVLAGIVLGLSLFFKTQDVLLVPVALLVSGRWKPVAAAGTTAAVLGAWSLISLGPSGIADWLRAIALVRSDPLTAPMTYSTLFGRGTLATAVGLALGATALGLAWYRRDRLDLVFALGLVGSTASATYLHEDDIAILVLAAWIVLRSQPSVPQRVWVLLGIGAAQLIALGLAIPMLLWEPGWIALLGLEPRLKNQAALNSRAVKPSSLSAEKSGLGS